MREKGNGEKGRIFNIEVIRDFGKRNDGIWWGREKQKSTKREK